MECFRIIVAGVFALTCSKTAVAGSNNLLSISAPGGCQIMPLVDDINKLNLEDPEFEIELLEALAQRDRKGRYYIANSECKDEIMHFLNRACDSNDHKPQVVCEVTYLLTKKGAILEKYKSLSPYQQRQVQRYFDELYMDILSKDEETVLDITKIDEEELEPTKEKYEDQMTSGIGVSILGIITGLTSGSGLYVLWPAEPITIALLSPFFIGGFLSLIFGPSIFLEAKKRLKTAKVELKKIDSNTGLKSSEMTLLMRSFVENIKLEYAHKNKEEGCIRALK